MTCGRVCKYQPCQFPRCALENPKSSEQIKQDLIKQKAKQDSEDLRHKFLENGWEP
jgi:hypothetical protein